VLTFPQQCLYFRPLPHGQGRFGLGRGRRGCPKDRIRRTPQGEPGLNYLCEGYQRFFCHTGQAMRYMAEELRNQRPPAGLMKVLRDADGAQPGRPRPSPNRPCPCGSGRKYKHCCGKVSA